MRKGRSIVEALLEKRGIDDPDEIAEYLSDSPVRTYDPFDLLNMKEGIDLIMDTIKKGGRICIYGDYDADGVTSICILHQTLSHLTDNLSWYIPSRFTEGYGMNAAAVEKIAAEGTGLIITVDCGITSCEEVKRAKELGVEVLVTDHHAPSDVIPDCIVIDPKQEGETYPFRDLAGCGVAFKIAQALQRTADLPKRVINDVLDLVGTGTVGDIVPLVDENRTIVKYGIRKLNEGSRPSMKSLAEAISIGEITSENISFGIVPHINATGRMGSAGNAVNLFLSSDDTSIKKYVDILVSCNASRRSVQDEAYKKCEELINGDEDIIMLDVMGIHEGIAGIVAGKLKETAKRPVILATPTDEGILKGTGRSIPGVDIRKLLGAYPHLFIKFGGHKSACGFTMAEENFNELKEKVREDIRCMFEEDPSLTEQGLEYEMELGPEEVTMELAEALEKMEPFGEGNPSPVFAMKSVDIKWPGYMGNDGEHVRFTVEEKGHRVQCVLFRRAKEFSSMIEGDERVDLIGSVKSHIWNGTKRIQFIVEDMKVGN